MPRHTHFITVPRQAQNALALFGQGEPAFDIEAPAHSRRGAIGLSAADADCVIAWSDNRTAILSHHDQIAIFQLEVNLLARARLQMNALKS
jgi:hypothetical protein